MKGVLRFCIWGLCCLQVSTVFFVNLLAFAWCRAPVFVWAYCATCGVSFLGGYSEFSGVSGFIGFLVCGGDYVWTLGFGWVFLFRDWW